MNKIISLIALIIILLILTGFYSKISIAISLGIIIFISSFLLFILYKILKVWRKKPEIGTFVGEECEAYENIKAGKTGNVLFKGELWNAISEEDIKKGEKLIIAGKDHWRLIVKKK